MTFAALDATAVAQDAVCRMRARLPRVTLADLTDAVVQILRLDLARRGDELLIEVRDSERVLEGDLSRVAQVMADLLDSASRASATRLTVRVAIQRYCLIMHASDDGPGIGLALTRGLIETYGHAISCYVVESALRSEIFVRVPLPVSVDGDSDEGQRVWLAVKPRGELRFSHKHVKWGP